MVWQIQILLAAQVLCVSLATKSLSQTCPGDCDGNHMVIVSELVTGVRIALGEEALSACPAFDVDGDGKVSINELVAAVRAALGTCAPLDGSPTSTVTITQPPTVAPTPTVAAIGILKGRCLRPGTVENPDLRVCEPGAQIRAERCEERRRCYVEEAARTLIGSSVVQTEGRFEVPIVEPVPASQLVLFYARIRDLEGQVSVEREQRLPYPELPSFDSSAIRRAALAGGAAPLVVEVGDIDPNSEGATRAIAELIDSVVSIDPICVVRNTRQESEGGTLYAGLTVEQAAEQASAIAAQFVEPTNLLLAGRVSADGIVYYVLSALGSASSCSGETIHVTTLGASSDGTMVCQFVQGGGPGAFASAGGGVLQGLQVLHPYDETLRSRVLRPNSDVVRFTRAGSGRLILGSGAEAIKVCVADEDCVEGVGVVESLHALDTTPGAPAACIANGVNPGCALANLYNTFSFAPTSSGDPPTCDFPNDVTVNARICAPVPPDGFPLRPGEVVVLVFGVGGILQGQSFSVAAAGFTIAPAGGLTLICEPNQVLRPLAVNDSIIVPMQ